MKKLFKINLIILLAFTGLFFVACDRSNNDKVQPVDSIIGKSVKLYSNVTLEGGKTNSKNFAEETGSAIAGQKVKVLEFNGWSRYKVELPDGTMGWLNEEDLKPAKNTFIKHTASGPNKNISETHESVYANRKIIKEVNEKTAVTRLEKFRQNGRNGAYLDWTKVKTEDGTVGWIMSDYLFWVVMEPNRTIIRKQWFYKMDYFKNRWIGKPIEKLEKKYKEPSGVKVSGNEKTAYFNNIFLLDGHKEYYSIRVYETDGIINNIDAGTRRTNYASYMPLSSSLKINFLANYIGNWQQIFEDDNDLNKEHKAYYDSLPNWLTVVIAIIIFIIFLGILAFVLMIPYYLVNRLIQKISMNRKLFNGRILLYAIVASLVFGYIYYILMVVNVYPFNRYFFITTLFCLGMPLTNIYKWRNNLDYNRCNKADCHRWTGEDDGTEFLGGNQITQRIRRGDGSTETNVQTTRHYIDYRKCSACGHMWSIRRTEVIGGLKV